MRQLAPGYVGDARFASCGWPILDTLIGRGMQVDSAIAIWSLQHSPRVADDIDRIRRVLKPGGKLFVCNLYHFAVPTNQGWTDLDLDIRTMLADAFEMVSVEGISQEHTTRSDCRQRVPWLLSKIGRIITAVRGRHAAATKSRWGRARGNVIH